VNQYDTLIKDFFYENKFISFEKIGTLTLSESYIPGHAPEPGSIKPQFDKKAETSPELAVYISSKTGKNRILLQSDLESYVELMRQFMNIGKPSEIEGIGNFKLGRTGEYVFEQSDPSQKKDDYKPVKKQAQTNESQFTSKNATNNNVVMLLALVIVLGLLGILGWGSYKLFIEQKPLITSQADSLQSSYNTQDSQAVLQTPPDTSTNTASVPVGPIDSIATTPITDTAVYKFIHERTIDSARAYSRTAKLRTYGYPAYIDSVQRDTITYYTLYVQYKLAAADTTRYRDSLNKNFQRKITIKRS